MLILTLAVRVCICMHSVAHINATSPVCCPQDAGKVIFIPRTLLRQCELSREQLKAKGFVCRVVDWVAGDRKVFDEYGPDRRNRHNPFYKLNFPDDTFTFFPLYDAFHMQKPLYSEGVLVLDEAQFGLPEP